MLRTYEMHIFSLIYSIITKTPFSFFSFINLKKRIIGTEKMQQALIIICFFLIIPNKSEYFDNTADKITPID